MKPQGCDPAGENCNPAVANFYSIVFTEFDAWAALTGDQRSVTRAAVARGQALFNTLAIPIREVSGINDDLAVAVVVGTCTTCHDTPHAGNHSVPAPLDIGVAAPPGFDRRRR